MNKSVVGSIGNSDNKLSQESWYHFCTDFEYTMKIHASQVHAVVFSESLSPYQNMAVWIDITELALATLKRELLILKHKYSQESIALLEGETEFV